jgi:ABC-type dipeptide/oligopeptide/nickel transport system permease subunit
MSHQVPIGSALITQAAGDAVDIPARRAEFWRRYRANRAAVMGLVVVVLLVLAAVFAPLVARHNPLYIPAGQSLLGPSASHWFGTDQQGRDIFARVVYGARTSMLIGLGSAFLATVIGVVVGSAAGYRQGVIDALLMRMAEVFLVLPAILLAGALIIVFSHGAFGYRSLSVTMALGLVGWPMVARVARASTMEIKHATFVDAAKVAGVSDLRIVWRHVLPHTLPAVAVVAVLSIGTSILAESSLSFLAVGVREPTPSWGLEIAESSGFISIAPHVVLFPSAAIFVTVLSFIAISEGVRDALGVNRR